MGSTNLQVTPGQARADLAQLEARLDRLQCHSIDAVPWLGWLGACGAWKIQQIFITDFWVWNI